MTKYDKYNRAALSLAVIEAGIIPYRPVCRYGQELVNKGVGEGAVEGALCDGESGVFWGYSSTGPLPHQYSPVGRREVNGIKLGDRLIR